MSLSRKEVLRELKVMFPGYDSRALNTLLRANGTPIQLNHPNQITNSIKPSILSCN